MDDFNFDDYMSIDMGLNQYRSTMINAPILLDADQIAKQPASNSRSYRPRNPRSCDFCRARKTACRVEVEPPCAACRSLGKDCTFIDRQRRRKRTEASSPGHTVGIQEHPLSREARKSMSGQSESSQEDLGFSWHASNVQLPRPIDATVDEIIRIPGNADDMERSSVMYEMGAHAHHMSDSIDGRPSATAFLLGDTGESDPYLLMHSSLAASDRNAASKISYRLIQREGERGTEEDKPLVFMIENHSLHDKYEPRVNDDVLRNAYAELESMCSNEFGVRLVKLYFKFVYPYFPVLSRSQTLSSSESEMSAKIQSFPLSLKAVLYATGLPFMVYDDVLSTTLDLEPPPAKNLYRICWLAITQEIHTPHLSTLQSCLLLLQRVNDDRYVMDSPFRWSLLGWTITLAQSLGLSTDCSDWQGIPAWEKRLRRRLWWATYVMDKWSFMSAGLTTLIKDEDFDVLPLTSIDFVSSDMEGLFQQEAIRDDMIHEGSHFYHLVSLSMILSDVINSYFTIRASRSTATNFALTLELAKPLRSRLHAWKELYDAFVSKGQNDLRAQARLDGNASLGLAYPVATMILFRALLRPLEGSSGSLEDKIMRENGREAVRAGAKACCVEVVQFLEHVKRGVWDAFWHSWSRAGFAIVSSFMVRLLITSTSPAETREFNNLIRRWRWTMRTGGGSAGNVLMSLGLLRLDRSLLKSGIRDSDEET